MGSLYSENSKSSQNWSLSFPEIPSNSKLFKSELICIVGNFWEFLGIPRKLGIQFARVICIIGNFWEFLGIPRNSQYILTSSIFHSKRGWQISSTSSREALVQCLTACPQYATLQLDVRVCALYRHLTVSLSAHWCGIQVTHAIAPAHYLLPRPSIT